MADDRDGPVGPEYGYWYTPLKGHHYRSPLNITGFYVNGVTEKKEFHGKCWRGGRIVGEVHDDFFTRDFSFDLPLPPGPYYGTWSLHWRDGWRDMTDIGDFYIRTPPE